MFSLNPETCMHINIHTKEPESNIIVTLTAIFVIMDDAKQAATIPRQLGNTAPGVVLWWW